MNLDNSTKEDHLARSRFVRDLVQRSRESTIITSPTKKPQKKIMQFWDDPNRLPKDVHECMDTWKKVEAQGIERVLFDKYQARDFIHQKLGARHRLAYDKCYHPAMLSDYFRLCYIFVEGGCYIDADDVCEDSQIQHLFNDDLLKIQPLCYNTTTNSMVPTPIFTKPGANSESWIFYFNNNPLIAGSAHPLIERALTQATLYLEKIGAGDLPEIQSTTGPGNLTKSIFIAAIENSKIEQSLFVMHDWESIAKNKWELSYRNDVRNWRLSNCRGYP